MTSDLQSSRQVYSPVSLTAHHDSKWWCRSSNCMTVGWNKLRAVPAGESQNSFGLPELRGACSSLQTWRGRAGLNVEPGIPDKAASESVDDRSAAVMHNLT